MSNRIGEVFENTFSVYVWAWRKRFVGAEGQPPEVPSFSPKKQAMRKNLVL